MNIFDEEHYDEILGHVHRTVQQDSNGKITILQSEERASGGSSFYIDFSAEEWNRITAATK
jgi:hypothetical protein